VGFGAVLMNRINVELHVRRLKEILRVMDRKDIEDACRQLREEIEGLMGASLTEEQDRAIREAAEIVRKELEAQVRMHATFSILQGVPHKSWYEGGSSNDLHFPAYLNYLESRKGWDEKVLDSIREESRRVVSCLANPADPDTFPCRGLVVGHVQSGKTANMMAVIARAVDAGYNLVIILAGLTDALRNQTQGRIESDLLNRNPHNWIRLTKGDHDNQKGEYQGLNPGTLENMKASAAAIAVIKKNVAPLSRLKRDLERLPDKRKNEMRVLIIDDEADQASPNAANSGDDNDMTAINRRIRELIATMPHVAYVGYTATPFANVLINPYPETKDRLDDLYPRDFIIALPTPDRYFGPERLFGRPAADPDDEEADGLDFIRDIPAADTRSLLPARGSDAPTFHPAMCSSLEEALQWHVLSSAARLGRGQEDHHMTMLVHTSMRTILHDRTADLVRNWKEEFERNLRNGDASLLAGLKDLWEREAEVVPDDLLPERPEAFEEVLARVPDVLERLEIVVENAPSAERLDYSSDPSCWIVVGGNILSRGLTLEGLCTTYFLRQSRQYDSLLQMGRWFGYREGYADLQRIWMPDHIRENFRKLALVEHELREEIAEYARRNATPEDFAVRIRVFPGLVATARAKMRHARTVDIDYAGRHLQTIRFRHRDREMLARNWQVGGRLLELAGGNNTVEKVAQGFLWKDVPLEIVLQFLAEYAFDESARDLSGGAESWVCKYLQNNDELLAHWNVGLIQPAGNRPHSENSLGPVPAPALVNRARLRNSEENIADIKALMSKRDVLIDCPREEPERETPPDSWEGIKAFRESTSGSIPLLLLYAIDRNSTPRHTSSRVRIPLDAAHDILGVGIVFPEFGMGHTGRTHWISVDVSRDLDAEDVDRMEMEGQQEEEMH